MSERVAIVGSREGVPAEVVRSFVRQLWEKHPDTILVSGGAVGVDRIAEQEWLRLGGQVESYRPVQMAVDVYGVEKWELGGSSPRVYALVNDLTFENYKSAALYRDTMIAEAADRIVGFVKRGGSRGTEFTLEWGEESQPKPRYRYEIAA